MSSPKRRKTGSPAPEPAPAPAVAGAADSASSFQSHAHAHAGAAGASAQGDQQPEAAAAASLFDRLPDAILSQILECLGLRAAAQARAVCVRWREAAAAVLWKRLDFEFSQSAEIADALAGLAAACIARGDGDPGAAAAAPAAGRPWIRAAPGASLLLETGVHAFAPPTTPRPPVNPLPNAVALVAACAAASGGLGSVDAHFTFAVGVGGCILGLLGALVPPGAAACPALRSLALRCEEHARAPEEWEEWRLPDAFPADLGRALAALPNLERLLLPRCCAADERVAEALAASLPRLRRLEINVWDDAAAGCLAALPGGLEVLALHAALSDPFDGAPREAAPLLEALAAGPSAASLKELRIPESYQLCGAALRALPRLPALQRLLHAPPVMLGGDEDLSLLGDCAALAELPALHLWPTGEGAPARLAGLLAGLAAALERSTSLSGLNICIRARPPWPEALAALAALVRAAGGRHSLELEVDLAARETAEVAAALAAAPTRRLALKVSVDEAALEGGLLAGLAAFAACSEDIELRLRVGWRADQMWREPRSTMFGSLVEEEGQVHFEVEPGGPGRLPSSGDEEADARAFAAKARLLEAAVRALPGAAAALYDYRRP
eukprot:tig00020616_g12265.t1